MNISLQNKTAIICGSTQGIGLASAIEMAALGANCFLMARNEDSLKEALKQLDTSLNQQHAYIVADFDKPETVKAAIEIFVQNNQVHILINNSGDQNGTNCYSQRRRFYQYF
jgi:3-oxoacyl-[acyl-carrier protein] reductase